MPATDPFELQELRKSTDDLIAEDSVMIVLHRVTTERTAAMEIRKTEDTPQPAKARFFGHTVGRMGLSRTVSTEQGQEQVSNHVLIGPAGDDIRKDDWFEVDGRKFLVIEIETDTSEYQSKAWCIERA